MFFALINPQSSNRTVCCNQTPVNRTVTRVNHCKLFSVFTSHVIKTKNRNHPINKFKNLGYDSNINSLAKNQVCCLSFACYSQKCVIQIYRALYGDVMFVATLGSRGYFFLIDTDGWRRSCINEEKNNLWSQEYATSFPCKKSVQNLNWVTDWILPCQVVRCSQSGPLLYCKFPADMGVSNR